MAVEKHKMMRTQKYQVARSLLTFMLALGIQRCAASTPVLLPSVKQAQITLNGPWKMTLNPPVDFWQNSVKATDPSRPVIASYQIVMDVKGETYDIKSHHYPKWNSDFAAVPMPTLYDEWMHVPGHNADAWFHDLNCRDYWGRSLDKAWANLFSANGSIGAAIWQYVDDVTYMPSPRGECARGPVRFIKPEQVQIATPIAEGNVFGVARWGLVDEWRRKKPEFWHCDNQRTS